jgi:uncharacterized protein
MPFSRYLRVMERDGTAAVFHALKPIPAFLSAGQWRSFCESMEDDSLRSWLKNQGLLVESSSEDDLLRDAVIQETLGRKMMSILYLVLTKACNFRCRQCFQYERHPDIHPELAGTSLLMTNEVAKLGIDAFVRHYQESDGEYLEPQIYFYGGEPLLNWDVLRYSVEYANSLRGNVLPQDLGYVVITNGSLVDDDKAAFFARHNIGIGLSIDGPKSKNDAFRLSVRGQGTYDTIVSALRVLQRHDVDVTLSITVNPNIVSDLSMIVRWAKEEMRVGSVSFNMVGGSSYAYTGADFPLDEYDDMLSRNLVEAYRLARDIGLHEDRIGRKVSDFIDHSFKAVDCGAVNNQLVIQPDGSIAFCHASTDYNVGTVTDPKFRIFGHPAIQSWEDVLPIRNPKCQTCPAMSVCGYGCFHHVLELGRRLADKDSQFCKHTRAVMEFMVWNLWEKTRQESFAA